NSLAHQIRSRSIVQGELIYRVPLVAFDSIRDTVGIGHTQLDAHGIRNESFRIGQQGSVGIGYSGPRNRCNRAEFGRKTTAGYKSLTVSPATVVGCTGHVHKLLPTHFQRSV